MNASETPIHEIDDLDREIMNRIREEPGLWTPAKLAGALAKSKSTLEKHVKVLRDTRLLQDVTKVQVAALGYSLRYRVDVKINPKELRTAEGADKKPLGGNPQKRLARQILEELAPKFKNVIVEDITILLGDPADLCVTVRAKTHKDIFRWVTEGLRPMAGIENTSTSHEAWSIWTGDLYDADE